MSAIDVIDDFYFRTMRGKFSCSHCERTFSTRQGVADHSRVHGYVAAHEAKLRLKRDFEAVEIAAQEQASAEQKRLADRKSRKVVLSTDDVDEIVAEINSLIDMMEPYWSQGDADKSARNLIERLEAMADGCSGALLNASPSQSSEGK